MGPVARRQVFKVHLHKGLHYFFPWLHCSNLKQVRVSRRWPQDKGQGKAQLLRETDALCLCPQYCGHLWVLSLSPHTLLSYGRDRGPQAPCPHTCAFLHVVSLWESCSFLSCETPISNVASLVNTPCTPTLDPSHKVKWDFLRDPMPLCSGIVTVDCPLSDSHCFDITKCLVEYTRT